jgi:hypothetical protein
MKNIFLFFLLLPYFTKAQEPVRHLDFVSHNNGFYIGEMSVSHQGKLLLATFTDLDKSGLYELINTTTCQLIAKGKLDDAPAHINWSEDDQQLVIEFLHIKPVCFQVNNKLVKLFSFPNEGPVTFSPPKSIRDLSSKPTTIKQFGREVTYTYDLHGKITDSIEQDDEYPSTETWYDQLHNRYIGIDENGNGLHIFSAEGKWLSDTPIPEMNVFDDHVINADGKCFIQYNDADYSVFAVATGKQLLHREGGSVHAVTFTPDQQHTCLLQHDSLIITDITTGRTSVIPSFTNYYARLFYMAFGTELIGVNPDGVDVYACKNYLPVNKAVEAIPQRDTIIEPVEPIMVPAKPVEQKWILPYTISDFITPHDKDSFALLPTPGNNFYISVVYSKSEPGIWNNPYNYRQAFMTTDNNKALYVEVMILQLDPDKAIAGFYQKLLSIGDGKDGVFGSGYAIGEISSNGSATPITWDCNLQENVYHFSALITDNIYHGVKNKCLVVTRKFTEAGINYDEKYWYQKGEGLVKIENNGKMLASR